MYSSLFPGKVPLEIFCSILPSKMSDLWVFSFGGASRSPYISVPVNFLIQQQLTGHSNCWNDKTQEEKSSNTLLSESSGVCWIHLLDTLQNVTNLKDWSTWASFWKNNFKSTGMLASELITALNTFWVMSCSWRVFASKSDASSIALDGSNSIELKLMSDLNPNQSYSNDIMDAWPSSAAKRDFLPPPDITLNSLIFNERVFHK